MSDLWALQRGSFGYEIGRIVRATDKKVIVLAYSSKVESHWNKSNVKAMLPEAEIRKLHERLASSLALNGDEKRASDKRHIARSDEIISKATSSPAPSKEDQ